MKTKTNKKIVKFYKTDFVLMIQESSGPQEFHLREVDRVLARFEPRTDDEDDIEDDRINGEVGTRA